MAQNKMFNKKEKETLKKARSTPYFISIKSSVSSAINTTLIILLLSFYFQKDNNLPYLLIILISLSLSITIYLVITKFLFGSILIGFKTTIIYLKIKMNRLLLFIFRK